MNIDNNGITTQNDFLSRHGENIVRFPQVLEALDNALKPGSNLSKVALEKLQTWERDSTPGFIASLIQIVSQISQIPEEIRLAAAILAKNTVGNSWRKTVDTREWLKVSDEEKEFLRGSLLSLLWGEGSEKIVQQLVLLIGNIARFDYPQKWPTILQKLLEAASFASSNTIDIKIKAALALKQVLFSLTTKITVSHGLHMHAVKLAMEEAKVVPKLISEVFTSLFSELHHYITSFRLDDNNCFLNGRIAKYFLSSSRFALELINNIRTIPNIKSFYENLYFYSTSIFQVLVQSVQQTTSYPIEYLQIQSDIYFKIIHSLRISLEKHTFEFSEYLFPFVNNYTESFVQLSSTIRSVCDGKPSEFLRIFNSLEKKLFPSEKVMKIMQFLTKVLVCPILQEKFWARADYLNTFSKFQFLPSFFLTNNKEETTNDDLLKTKESFNDISKFFTSQPLMTSLISIILSKYMSFSKSELENWENDPETFIKEIEAQDTLRQSSEELLLALSVYNPKLVEDIENLLVNQLKQLGPSAFSTLNDNILNLDACYKSIALISLVVQRSHQQSVIYDINQWFTNELKDRIEQTCSSTLLHEKIILFRVLWIIRKLSFKLDDSIRLQLLKSKSLITCLYSHDIVISLQSIITIHSLLLSHKEYSFFHHSEDDKVDETESEVAATFSSKFPKFKPTYLPTTQQLPIGEIINGCFLLLPKLSETESRLQILNLIIHLIKIVGKNDILANVNLILQNLPMLWENLGSLNTQETGSEIRLKKELISLISCIVNTVSSSLFDVPNLFDISVSTLKQAIDYPILASGSPLPKLYTPMSMEEGFELWASLMRNSQTLSQPLFDLFPILIRIIQLNIEVISAFQMLEAYILLGGSGVMTRFGVQIFESINFFIVNYNASMTMIVPYNNNNNNQNNNNNNIESISSSASEKSLIIQSLYCLETILRMFPVEGALLFKTTLQYISTSLCEKAEKNNKGEKYDKYSEDIISRFVHIIARVIVQNPQQFVDLISPTLRVQSSTFLNHFLQILLYEIQLHSINELFSLMLSINSSRNRKILATAMLVIILQLSQHQIEYFSQSLISVFEVIQQLQNIEERRKLYSKQLHHRMHKCKLDEIFYEITENDPLYEIDLNSYFQQACQLYISRFGTEKFLSHFDSDLHPELDKLISADDSQLTLNSLTV